MMIKGGQQFFSNYLRAFKDTVDKLTELVDITRQGLPVYTKASNNYKEVKSFGVALEGLNLKGGLGGYDFIVNNTGSLRVKMDYRKTAATSLPIKFTANGLQIGQVNSTATAGDGTTVIDISVSESDKINIVYGAGDLYLNNISMGYDEVERETVVL